jgi:hypothetical protein
MRGRKDNMKLVSVVFKCPDPWIKHVEGVIEELKKQGINESEIEYYVKNWRDWDDKK